MVETNLANLLQTVDYQLLQGSIQRKIHGVCYDSRKVNTGDIFVALVGTKQDGHEYLSHAFLKGAVVLVVEHTRCLWNIPKEITVIKVKNTRKTLSSLSFAYFLHPQKKCELIGITGTKGKTTIAMMIAKLMEQKGVQIGVIGTLGIMWKTNNAYEKKIETTNTTPESYEIAKALKEMTEDGVKLVIMEVSSLGVKGYRIWPLQFQVGVFSNFGRDHIGQGEHKNLEEYFSYKVRFLLQCKKVIINVGNESGRQMLRILKEKKESQRNTAFITYGYYPVGTPQRYEVDCCASNYQPWKKKNRIGGRFWLEKPYLGEITLGMVGEINVENALASIAVATEYQVDLVQIKQGLFYFSLPGRMETIFWQKRWIVIDYAHNAISLQKSLETLKSYQPKRIICVFGCGGNRSVDRRRDMGRIGANYAQMLILTEDNSRWEPLENILWDIEKGIKEVSNFSGKYVKILDRKKAISFALEESEEQDMILLAGKGHECYQERCGIRYPFDERSIVNELCGYHY